MLSTVPTRRELLAWTLALAMAFAAITVANSQRVQAGEILPVNPSVAYLATGANFPDALAAAATAALGLGPVLLVAADSVPTPTLNELNRLEPDTLYVVGGTAVISEGVVTTLENLPFSPTVERIAGSNRYATAAALSAATFPSTGLYPRADFDSSAFFTLTAGADTVAQVTIVAPATGIVVASAGIDLLDSASNAEVSCWIEVGNAEIEGSRRTAGLYGSTAGDDEDCTTQVGVAISKGTRTFEFVVLGGSGISNQDPSLWVAWFPFDGYGHVPQP